MVVEGASGMHRNKEALGQEQGHEQDRGAWHREGWVLSVGPTGLPTPIPPKLLTWFSK